jgi:predicted RNA-binding Zn ribbon-like protein
MPRRPPRYDVPRAAPPPLDLVQALVNSRDHENDREWLGSDADLGAWLAARELPAEGASVERFKAVREALRALLIANNERRAVPAAALGTLNAEAARSPVAVRFGPRDAVLEGTDALGTILAAAYAGMAAGTWPRLKACRNCHWAFYDESKNRSATWCSMQLCGNRLKTRRFRSRHA